MAEVTHERRRAQRARADFTIRMTQRTEARPGSVLDISENGLCCTFPEAIREMTLVNIDLQLPEDSKTHAIQGAVVRCEKRRNIAPPTYEIAVYFTDLNPDARQQLRDYVTRCAIK